MAIKFLLTCQLTPDWLRPLRSCIAAQPEQLPVEGEGPHPGSRGLEEEPHPGSRRLEEEEVVEAAH